MLSATDQPLLFTWHIYSFGKKRPATEQQIFRSCWRYAPFLPAKGKYSNQIRSMTCFTVNSQRQEGDEDMRGKGKAVKLEFHEVALTAETWINHPKFFCSFNLDFHMRSLWQDRNLKHWPCSHGAERCLLPAWTRSWFQCTLTQMLPRPCQQKSCFWQVLSDVRHWEEGKGVVQGRIFFVPIYF